MFLRSLATAACCTLLATASFAEMNGQMDKPAGQVLPSPAATADVTLGRQGHQDHLQRSLHARPKDHGWPGSVWRGLAHRSESRHHTHHHRQPQDWHSERPRRHLHPLLHPAQRQPVAAHRQQADRPVGQPYTSRTRTLAALPCRAKPSRHHRRRCPSPSSTPAATRPSFTSNGIPPTST